MIIIDEGVFIDVAQRAVRGCPMSPSLLVISCCSCDWSEQKVLDTSILHTASSSSNLSRNVGNPANHTIVSRIITYESISKNTWLTIRENLCFLKNISPNLLGLGNFPQNIWKRSYRQTDRWTDKLIWGGLGNLRFLQVNLGWVG